MTTTRPAHVTDTSAVRILLVEDDPAYAAFLMAWAESRDARMDVMFDWAPDLAGARAKLERPHNYLGVALDLYLPGITQQDPTFGLRQLRQIDHCPPILVLTSSAEDLGDAATRDGAADFIVKTNAPAGLEQLVLGVQQAAIRQELTLERERLLRNVQAHNDRLTRVAKVIAHDMITPVAIALSSVETAILLMENDQTDNATKILDLAKNRLTELSNSMGNILDETIRGTSAVFAVNISDLAERAFTALAPSDRERLHLVTIEGPAVRALPGTLLQVLQNLMANAVRHNPGHVAVTIEAHEMGDQVRVVIDDDGAGWTQDPEDLAADGTSTAGSSGIGLTTVIQAVERMDGVVNLGTSPSGGVRVVIDLPAAQTTPSETVTDEAIAVTKAALDSKQVRSQP